MRRVSASASRRVFASVGGRVGMLVCLIALAASGVSRADTAESPQITKKVLENGLTIIVKPEPGTGLVAIDAAIRAGAAQESIQNAGLGNFVAQLLLASTRLSSAEEVAAIADQVGGNIAAQWHPDYTDVRAVTTSAMFNRAMNLIGESLTEANFETKYVEQVRTDLLRNLSAASDDTFDNAYQDLRELLYQDNGYRRDSLGSERTIKDATPQDLKKFLTTYYVPNNIVISVVGDVTVEQAIKRADMAFSGVPAARLPLNRGVPDEALERNTFHASEAEVPVAYLMVAWLAPPVISSDFPAMLVAAHALGGGKGSLMFRELRQKRGMGYDVGVLYPKYKYQSHMVAYVATDPYKQVLPGLKGSMVLDEVKTALLQQISDLKQKPLSDKDLQRAKGYTIGKYALSQQHLLDRACQLAWLEAIGAGYQSYAAFPTDVEKVTAADVQRVARKYFTKYAAVLIMPKTTSPPAETAKKVGS